MSPKKKVQNNHPVQRTKYIPIVEEKSPLLNVIKPQSDVEYSYRLHIDPPKSQNEIIGRNAAKNQPNKAVTVKNQSKLTGRKLLERKIWNTLEWLATSALIFIVLFFALNYQAYSALFFSKLDKLRGNFQASPFLHNLFQNQPSVQTQQPLPITVTVDQGKKLIPYLNMEIAPLDDRIIISRINRNVPIIRAKSENLIKRNWDGLEKDIQEALRGGVVHYPGTAEPGENGNVVITGHSSYFAWDPGRFKDVFALLHEVAVGDRLVIYHQQKKYFYEVYKTKVVMPEEVDILTQKGDSRLTLITCTPVGTNLKRLIVFAKPI